MKNITFRQLECFLEACRDFHFSNAARRLNLAQPPFSRHIRELKTVVGVRLFERSTKSVSLTRAGELFLQETFSIPSSISRAIDAARRAALGEESQLRIGFVGALLGEDLLKLFQDCRLSMPQAQLSLLDASPRELIDKVVSGEIDGAFLGIEPARLQSKVSVVNWKSEPLYVCLPRGHALAGKRRLRVDDIVGENWISLSKEVAPFYRGLLESVFEDAGRRPVVVRDTTGVSAILGMVVAGIGLALLPRSALTIQGASIVARRLDSERAMIDEVFAYGRRNKSETLRAFMEILRAP